MSGFMVSQNFVKSHFPTFHLNSTYSFNPSFDLNFTTKNISLNGSTLTNLFGLPDKTQLTVIANFENSGIVESDKVNYVGKLSFKEYSKNIESNLSISTFFTAIGTIGVISFATMFYLNK
jgi:hypothetical protein